MTEMISYCGLLCNECPAFIATQTNEPFIQYIPHARKKTGTNQERYVGWVNFGII